ncbi:MAG: hypothetical protein G3M70_01130 [Candidatus Nitronauta litoralis]|uniref:Uncharacterized protein n=1 Tax=Candidatus Nitronauta litoralis TaxID=2705533 RepID=A0A7T0BU96_9BACT|nr:MAG: hypothetical protein G3M70_01130 [Candidatus Nitronauta litoralis]
MSNEMDGDYEPGGITMGPEERLEREIAKSKSLKVERLQLRDRISRLEEKVEALDRENSEMARKLAEQAIHSPQTKIEEASKEQTCGTGLANNWILGGMAILLIASVLLAVRWFLG